MLDNGPLERLEDNLWMVRGALPDMPMPLKRTMTVMRTSDGRLVIHSAIALEEAAMRELEAAGKPAILVVPNGWHRLDAHAYKTRYPDIKVLCPAKQAKRVRECVPVDGALEDFGADDHVRVEPLDGFKVGEGVFIVKSGPHVTLVFNDLFMNQPHLPGFWGFLYGAFGASGGPRVHPMMRLFSKNKPLRAHLERLATIEGLFRIIPGHGDPVLERPAESLAEVAGRL